MAINIVHKTERPGTPGFYVIHMVADAVGGTEYIPTSGLFRPTCQSGLVLQGVGPGTISYALTLCEEDKAVNPDPNVQSSVPWTADIPLTCGSIVRDPNFLLATALKLTITGPAELYLAVL